jgi:hypothetical protein
MDNSATFAKEYRDLLPTKFLKSTFDETVLILVAELILERAQGHSTLEGLSLDMKMV